jgi:hypothetical protein
MLFLLRLGLYLHGGAAFSLLSPLGDLKTMMLFLLRQAFALVSISKEALHALCLPLGDLKICCYFSFALVSTSSEEVHSLCCLP